MFVMMSSVCNLYDKQNAKYLHTFEDCTFTCFVKLIKYSVSVSSFCGLRPPTHTKVLPWIPLQDFRVPDPLYSRQQFLGHVSVCGNFHDCNKNCNIEKKLSPEYKPFLPLHKNVKENRSTIV